MSPLTNSSLLVNKNVALNASAPVGADALLYVKPPATFSKYKVEPSWLVIGFAVNAVLISSCVSHAAAFANAVNTLLSQQFEPVR